MREFTTGKRKGRVRILSTWSLADNLPLANEQTMKKRWKEARRPSFPF